MVCLLVCLGFGVVLAHQRWLEEVGLLTEEMHRLIEYCSWAFSHWELLMIARVDVDDELREGLVSYTHEWMLTEKGMSERWVAQWSTVFKRAHVFLGWTNDVPSDNSEAPVEIN